MIVIDANSAMVSGDTATLQKDLSDAIALTYGEIRKRYGETFTRELVNDAIDLAFGKAIKPEKTLIGRFFEKYWR